MALTTSLGIAVAAAVAFPVAWAGWRRPSWLTRLLQACGSLPIMLPQVVLALVFMVFWSKLGLAGHVASTVISHAVVFAAIPLAFISLGFRSVDRQLVEAATTLGATGSDVLRTVVLPIVMPYVCSGFVFVFVSSLNEYIFSGGISGGDITHQGIQQPADGVPAYDVCQRGAVPAGGYPGV
ncbi:MAG: ABC transporter permease [Sodalis sp. (in: enterobacteria)]|uniref:ABC transporter permease n=1 Tax=Sodalis sp. (in: enterobacteria) TaxID=1898979 RepID=UPI0039E6C72C